jgi:mucin-19
VGLFGRIGNDGAVHSLILEDVDITGNIAVGALAGYARGEFSDIHVSGEVNGVSYVGGFVGYMLFSNCERISAQVTVTAEDGFAGGLVGFMFAEISDSWAGGDVSGVDSVGGLAGMLTGELRFSYASGNVSGQDKVGGLIGETGDYVAIMPEIEQSYASGSVHGDNRVGGLIGFHPGGPVENCYSIGRVSGSGSAVGGLIGWNGGYTPGSQLVGEIVNCYVAGEVDGSGVFFGYLSPYGVGDVHDVYWDSESTGIGSGEFGTGLNTAEFGDDSNFDNWDFDNIWQIGVSPDGHERPVFLWQVE